jgi:hypothetical protein
MPRGKKTKEIAKLPVVHLLPEEIKQKFIAKVDRKIAKSADSALEKSGAERYAELSDIDVLKELKYHPSIIEMETRLIAKITEQLSNPELDARGLLSVAASYGHFMKFHAREYHGAGQREGVQYIQTNNFLGTPTEECERKALRAMDDLREIRAKRALAAGATPIE